MVDAWQARIRGDRAQDARPWCPWRSEDSGDPPARGSLTLAMNMTKLGAPCRAALALWLVVTAGPAAAQPAAQTREAEIHGQQAAKASRLTPAQLSPAERVVERLEPVLLATEPSGFYPWFGSVLGGGMLGLGAGYRMVYADTGSVNVYGGWSLRNYRTLDARAALPTFLDGRATVSLHAKYLFADKVSFYGLGRDSDEDRKSSFTYEPTTMGASLQVQPVAFLRLGAGLGYEAVKTSGGGRAPSVEQEFSPATAPGLGEDVDYLVTHASAAIDWRESPGYTTSGGLYRIEHRRYDARDNAPWSFDATEVELQQFVPILRANWVLAFRALGTVTYGRDGDEVPFFMMPTLGSGDELRGFANRRFRDRNRLLVQAEYRWRPSKFIDLAVFYDAGKVEGRRGDLDFDGLQSAWGGGIRFHGPSYTGLRLEVAKSREGLALIVAGGPSF